MGRRGETVRRSRLVCALPPSKCTPPAPGSIPRRMGLTSTIRSSVLQPASSQLTAPPRKEPVSSWNPACFEAPILLVALLAATLTAKKRATKKGASVFMESLCFEGADLTCRPAGRHFHLRVPSKWTGSPLAWLCLGRRLTGQDTTNQTGSLTLSRTCRGSADTRCASCTHGPASGQVGPGAA